MENADLKGHIQEKFFVTTTLQNELRRLKGKLVLDNATTITNATTNALGMFKLDIEPLSHRLKNNRDAHEDYLKKTIENTDTIRGLVERARKQNPSKPLLDAACKFTKHVQELLVYVSQTCPSFTKPSEKFVAATSMNKVKKVSKVFTEVGYKWKPTGRLFTIVGNPCPLTRITPTKVVQLKETTSNSVETPKLEIKVYSMRPKQIKTVGSSKKAKIVESKIANNSEPNHSWGSNATYVPSSSSLVNDRLSRFFSADPEVAFQQNTCFIRNLEGVDLLSGSRDTNLYTISLDDMLKTSLISKDDLARGIPKLKFKKDHLCSACALGKSNKSSHQPKAKDTSQEKLYLLHMDVCGLMRVESINGKKYILLIVDDYSRFTWVKFLRSKDKAPDAIIKCIKNIQVCLNATVRNVRTDNERN
ncbi:retrovirus-related pol polyprotein from transposon TNT 1-94 [Tanacetum coccineum]